MKLGLYTFFVAVISACALQAASVSSGVFGAYQIECPADSDTYVSIPVTRQSEFVGVVESVLNSEFKIVAKGEPNWAVNKFVYAKDSQSNYYYVKFTSGQLEGAWFNVLTNSAYALELEIGASELAKVSAGDSFEVIPHWSLNTLFPNGEGFTKNEVRGYGTGATYVYKFTAFKDGKLVYPTGKNNPPSTTYYYRKYNTTDSWMNGSSLVPDDIIEPNTCLIIRQPETISTTISVSGTMPFVATTIIASNLSQTTDTDNYIAIPAGVDMTLSELTVALVDSGVFSPATGRPYAAIDSLYVYDNSATGKNQPAPHTYYYRTYNGVSHWYEGSTIKDDVVLKAGTAMILRKRSTGALATARGKFIPSYIENK